MASKPLRPCRMPGCPELTRSGYCPAHTPRASVRQASAAWHSWYCLPIWTDTLRPMQLLREPFCRACAARGARTWATEVDHIVPHRGVWARFTDPDGLQSLCHHCHSAKTMREWNASRRERGG